ncbi:tRNA guanosine(34) transglycosylase Tgt [Lacunimicrobium album]
MSSFRFELLHTDSTTGARAGLWHTPHGVVETPCFMPVGTLATVKGVYPDQLKAAGTQKILANTYHLALRPGPEVVADMGGLHKFMNWDKPILTDSGGFQVFSLAKKMSIDDRGVVFRSHLDGSLLDLTPARATRIQEMLGADCIMCLDECPAHDVATEYLKLAVDRTTKWAQLCKDAHQRTDQALFGIVQGGIDAKMRERSATGLVPLDFPGYAIGGLSVGENPADMYRTLEATCPLLPTHKPRYLMGVGKPIDLLQGVLRGVDLFDCVMPTRNGRNAMAFTWDGHLKIRNLQYQRDEMPLDSETESPVGKQFTRAYIRHLFVVGEMLGPMILSLHNIAFYQHFMRELRKAILENRAGEFRQAMLTRWGMLE